MIERFISVVCASKNEEHDILNLCRSFSAQNFKDKELIIIDDSSDGTKDLVNSYIESLFEKNVVILSGGGNGCCPARNIGVKSARGSVICYMTADSFFPDSTYISYVIEKFESGIDAFMPNSLVSNTQDLYADFIHCWQQEKLKIRGEKYSPLTSQGYSVKKDSALKVGLIDTSETGKLPFNVCRDWTLVKKMDDYGFKKEFDKDFFVPHNAPSTISDFLWTHSQRGVISAGYNIFFRNKSRPQVLIESLIKLLVTTLFILSFIGPYNRVSNIVRHSSQKRSIFDFLKCYLLKTYSFHYGEISSIFKKL